MHKPTGRKRKLSAKAVLCLFAMLLMCTALVVITAYNRSIAEESKMEELAMEKSKRVYEVVSKLLYKTQVLAVFANQGEDAAHHFEQMAATLVDDPAILNVLLAPGGVVEYVYPLAGNEDVLGLDFFSDGNGNREAVLSKERGELVFGGPFELVQGGLALVGRLPVYREQPDGEDVFWGFVSVTLRYPEVLESAGLNTVEMDGFSYEIWRINPDTGQRQVIAASHATRKPNQRFIEKHIPILNADWYFNISPVLNWYQYGETWFLLCLGICLSVMVTLIIQNNEDLRLMQCNLECMVQTDALTGIRNRSGLLQEVNRLIRLDKRFLLYYIDLNAFKQINDVYGHSNGDLVLREFSSRMDEQADGSHIIARIAGDEFILIHVDNTLDPANMVPFWTQLSDALKGIRLVGVDQTIDLDYSYGHARYPGDGATIDQLIVVADRRMYRQKKEKKDGA